MTNHRPLIPVLAALLLAACGADPVEPPAIPSAEAMLTTEPRVTDDAPADGALDRLPDPDRLSAADFEPGQGANFCEEYPEPQPEAYQPDQPFRAISPDEVAYGDPEAPVSAVVYGRPGCEVCAEAWEAVKAEADAQPQTVAAYYRLVVPDGGEFDTLIAEAAREARTQGGIDGYDAFLQRMAEDYGDWATRPTADRVPLLKDVFRDIGLDADALETALDEGTHTPSLEARTAEAAGLGIEAYPVVFFNDFGLARQAFEQGEEVYGPFIGRNVEAARLPLAYPDAPPMVIDPGADYGAWIVTPEGTIALDLFPSIAPQTVNNFAYLSCIGFYDDNQFHRVIPDFVAQGGDPSGGSFGGVGYTIPDEWENSDLVFNQRGWLSMAKRTEPDTASSQFFITLGPTENLSELGFTIFGQLVEGDDVLSAIEPRQPSQSPTVLPPGTPIETIIVRRLEE